MKRFSVIGLNNDDRVLDSLFDRLKSFHTIVYQCCLLSSEYVEAIEADIGIGFPKGLIFSRTSQKPNQRPHHFIFCLQIKTLKKLRTAKFPHTVKSGSMR